MKVQQTGQIQTKQIQKSTNSISNNPTQFNSKTNLEMDNNGSFSSLQIL